MRKFLFALVLLLSLAFLIGKFAEVRAIAETLQHGDWKFILLATGIQSLWLFNVAAQYRAIYRAIGLEESFENLFLLSSSTFFINIMAPSAGVSGLAVFIAEARRRNYSPGRAMVAGTLYVFFDYLGVLSVVGLGLIVLFRRNNLTSAEIIATLILVVMAMFLGTLLYLGMRSARALGETLARIARQVNRITRFFVRKPYLSEKRAHAFAYDAAEGLLILRRKPVNILFPIVLALSNKALLLTILLLVFLAFKVPISIGTVVAGFSISYLFWIVSPTPAGIGIVEGALTLVLSSMYISLEAAAVITMAYRGITFWLPLFFGMLAFRRLHFAKGVEAVRMEKSL